MEHEIASRDEWTKQRKELLKKEKEASKLLQQLAAERRALPWVLVENDYEFVDSDQRKSVKLSELFLDGLQDLIVVHFMFEDGWDRGCRSCSFWADSYDGQRPHILQKANMVVVAKAKPEKIKEFKEWKEWKFPFLNSNGNTFNRDFGVEFTNEEVAKREMLFNYGSGGAECTQSPGWSVFHKGNDGKVYHTYSTYARGLDILNACYQWVDLLPKGRIEERKPDTQAWIQHKELYGNQPNHKKAEPWQGYNKLHGIPE